MKNQPQDPPGPGKAAPADRFMPLTELWQQEESGGLEQILQRQAEEAKRQQEEIISQARQEAELIRRRAHQEGYAEGERAGREEGISAYRQAIQRLEPVLDAVQNEVAGRNQRYEQEMLLLIKAMVDRLVHHEVSINPAVIQACLRQALQFVVQSSKVRVHLHPDDFLRLREASMEDPSLLEGKARIELVEDPAIAAGGCLLQTDFGEVDATLDQARTKLYEVVDRLFSGTPPDRE